MNAQEKVRVIEKAVEILNTGGWMQGDAGDESDPNTPHCVLGAVNAAVYLLYPEGSPEDSSSVARYTAYDAVADTLDRVAARDVVAFNDDEDTTRDDVIALLEDAKTKVALEVDL